MTEHTHSPHCPWCSRYSTGLMSEWCSMHRQRRRVWLRLAFRRASRRAFA